MKTLNLSGPERRGAYTTPDYSFITSNTDWINAVTRQANYNSNNLSISGSTEKNLFRIGLGYTVDEGIVKHIQQKRMLLSLADEFKFSKTIKVGFVLNTTRTQNPYSGAGSVLDIARKLMPQVSADPTTFTVTDPYTGLPVTKSIYSNTALIIQNSGLYNPLITLENEWNKFRSTELRSVGTIYGEINFLKHFNFRTAYYADVSNVDTRTYSPLYYAYNPATNTPYLYNTQTSVSESNQDWKKFQQDYILTYKRSLGEHNLTATGGFTTTYYGTFQRYATSKQGTGAADLPIPDDPRFWYISNGFGHVNTDDATSYQSENTTVSYLARLLYNYKSKYFLTASWRDDGSSRIPAKNRFQQFWALGAAWDISKESFLQNISTIDYLKLKGSIGVLGNQSTYGAVGDYPAYPGLKSGTTVNFGSSIVTGAQAAYQVNPDLRWETVNASEVGFELNAFNNRLHFEGNYYNKKTRDMMTYISLSSLGLDDKLTNGGVLRNWGEEFSASWNQQVNKELSITVGGNITFMKNKVLSVADDLPGGQIISGNARTLPGHPIGSFYGYIVDGLYQSNLDILSSPPATSISGSNSIRPGDFKFKDINGDGIINESDRTVIGNPSPDFIYGGNVRIKYRHLSVDVDWGGVYGNEVFRIWGSMEPSYQRSSYAAFKMNRWHGAGTSNWDPILSQKDVINYSASTYNIEDGSYFRIRNLQIGYEFDPGLLSKIHVKGLRVYANAQNLKTWKHNKGYTPEFGGSATSFGFDDANGAIPRVISFGINANF